MLCYCNVRHLNICNVGMFSLKDGKTRLVSLELQIACRLHLYANIPVNASCSSSTVSKVPAVRQYHSWCSGQTKMEQWNNSITVEIKLKILGRTSSLSIPEVSSWWRGKNRDFSLIDVAGTVPWTNNTSYRNPLQSTGSKSWWENSQSSLGRGQTLQINVNENSANAAYRWRPWTLSVTGSECLLPWYRQLRFNLLNPYSSCPAEQTVNSQTLY